MTDVQVDTVPASTDNTAMITHRICLLCTPEPVMGSVAVCGDQVLGIRPGKNICKRCEHMWYGHALQHRFGGRG